MQIDPRTLTDQQYFGLACVICGRAFAPAEQPARVGLVGDDLHEVFACAGDCAKALSELIMERA